VQLRGDQNYIIAEQIVRYRNHAIQLAKILKKVEARGGGGSNPMECGFKEACGNSRADASELLHVG
jgi:hypothetical protein